MSRWHGGGVFPKTPKLIKNILWGFPFALGSFVLSQPWFIVLSAQIMSSIGKATGHGGFMDLGQWTRTRKDEAFEFLIKWAKPNLPERVYDFIGLAIVGMAAVSGAAVSLALVYWKYSVIVLFGGAMKAIAYLIGHTVYPDGGNQHGKYFDSATALGEGLTGFFAYLAYIIVLFMALGYI